MRFTVSPQSECAIDDWRQNRPLLVQDCSWGFMGVLGSQENGVKKFREQGAWLLKAREQGAEESNLGSREHRVAYQNLWVYQNSWYLLA